MNGSTNESLRYQLYQDASYSNIWGDGVNGGMQKVITTTGAVKEHTVYARLFASNTLPTPGKYTDTLLVTISY